MGQRRAHRHGQRADLARRAQAQIDPQRIAIGGVRREQRHHPPGIALRRLARIACESGCGRFEWSVLDWNTPAIDFYRAMGATAMDEWTTQRVSGAALATLAGRG